MATNKFKVGDPKPATSGRKKGTGNKTTPEIREAIQKVMSKKIEELEADLELMNPFQQWMILEKVSKYFMPALNKNEDTVEHSGEIKITVSYTDSIGLLDNPQSLDQGEDYSDFDVVVS